MLGAGMDKTKLLEKLLELLADLPDKEGADPGGLDQKADDGMPEKGAEIAVLGLDKDPIDKKLGAC